MQDEVNDKTVRLCVTTAKLSGRVFANLIKKALAEIQKQMKSPTVYKGKQSVKHLVRSGAGVQSIEIADPQIRAFDAVARKYGLDFAVKRDPASKKYLVFFKARDADAMTAAFSEFTQKSVKRKARKPSLLAQLSKFKELAKEQNIDREKNRSRGELAL